MRVSQWGQAEIELTQQGTHLEINKTAREIGQINLILCAIYLGYSVHRQSCMHP